MKIQGYSNQNTTFFIKESKYRYIICKSAVILFRPQYMKKTEVVRRRHTFHPTCFIVYLLSVIWERMDLWVCNAGITPTLCVLAMSPCYGDTKTSRYGNAFRITGPRLNIKTVLSTYGDFHVKDKTAVRTSLTWELPYLVRPSLLLRRPPGPLWEEFSGHQLWCFLLC